MEKKCRGLGAISECFVLNQINSFKLPWGNGNSEPSKTPSSSNTARPQTNTAKPNIYSKPKPNGLDYKNSGKCHIKYKYVLNIVGGFPLGFNRAPQGWGPQQDLTKKPSFVHFFEWGR